jgi:phosphate transport system substrate-binding protein
VYVNAKPGEGTTPLVREFVKLILSKQGQQIVVKDGYFPVTEKLAEEDIAKVGK